MQLLQKVRYRLRNKRGMLVIKRVPGVGQEASITWCLVHLGSDVLRVLAENVTRHSCMAVSGSNSLTKARD